MPEHVAVAVLVATAGVFAFLIPFASHRSHLLLLSRRARREPEESWPEDRLPRVTIQLPVYTERTVVERAIDAACAQDYPAELLEVQVLDDSDDDTTALAAARVELWRARGVDARLVRREERTGFKAGALAFGMEEAKGDFFLVLDADFVPDPDLVRELLPPFVDPGVGMVQARWDHLNAEESWLTSAQSYLLDGHFFFEQGGRYRGRRFFNFNGTAGMWRRECLEEAGGWHFDTLTEDLDASYRAQMRGWRFAYLEEVGVSAEIPASVHALEVQQKRWAQGGVQTARKVLPTLFRGRYPVRIKVEAAVHLLGHLAHPLTWTLALLLFPSAVARRTLGLEHLLPLDLLLFGAATVPFAVFYWMAAERRDRPRAGRFVGVARTLALGIGLSIPVSHAVLRGLRSVSDPFVRTPKAGDSGRAGYTAHAVPVEGVVRLGMAALMSVYLVLAVSGRYWGQLPFILLFLSGYLATSLAAGAPGVEREKAVERQPHRGSDRSGLRPRAGRLVRGQPEVPQECEAA